MKILHFLALLTIFNLPFSAGYGQNYASPRYKRVVIESRRLIDSMISKQNIPGIDVALSVKGKIVWAEGFGLADIEHNIPVMAGQTRFRIGSVSKPLAAAALGKLVDKSKVNLDSSVQTYVPYFPVKKYPVTVRQVAGHLAGIRHYRGDEFLMKEHYKSVKSSLQIFQDDSLLFKPGSKYSYSTYGFNLISAVVEGASGEDFLTFIQREVFSPLHMTSTCADKNDSIIMNRSSFYGVDSLLKIRNAPYVDNSYKWAGGGFLSTTTDLIKFGEAHLKPGFFSESTLRELTTSQSSINGKSTGYGMGWSIINNKQLQGFGHSGGSVGGMTQLRIFPGEQVVLVMLSNSSNTDYGNLPDKIVKAFINARQ